MILKCFLTKDLPLPIVGTLCDICEKPLKLHDRIVKSDWKKCYYYHEKCYESD